MKIHGEITFTNSSPSTMTFPDPSGEADAEVDAVSRCRLICSNSAVVAVVVFLRCAALVVSLSHLGLGQNWPVDN
jgi:hypothetical protein